MPQDSLEIVGGFDCHLDAHVGVALDALGRRLGSASFATTAEGYREAVAWLRAFGTIRAAGIESTGSYGAALTRAFRDAGVHVLEINQPHRHTTARRGKSDAIDAEAAARKVLSGEATGAAKQTSGVVESSRLLRVAREGAIKARTAALGQLGDLLVTAPAALREQLATRKTLAGKASMCARFRLGDLDRTDPLRAAKCALRSVARRIAELAHEAATLEAELKPLVAAAAPRTSQALGFGIHHTATLLIAAGENIDRMRSETAFAHLCATAPLPASSGKTRRHRLNPHGNRSANRALHMAVVVRLRYCPATKAYVQRRLEQRRTKREAMRCLKRFLARTVYRSLRDDLASLATPNHPSHTT